MVNKKKSFLIWDKASFTLSFFYPKIHIAAMSQGNMFAGFEKFLGLAKKVQWSSPQKGSPLTNPPAEKLKELVESLVKSFIAKVDWVEDRS